MTRLARYAWLVLAWNVAVILWGATVRATGSGAGCGNHWPLCNGEVVPRAPAIETLIEFAHRLTSGVALLLVVALAITVFRASPRGHAARRAAAFSVFFILTEAAVGAGLVLLRLVADNESVARALFMATHLANTFLLLAALTLTALWTGSDSPRRRSGSAGEAWLLTLGLLALVLVGMSGAVAALGDTLYPARSLAEALARDLSPTAHMLIRLRLLHPFLAVAAAVLIAAAAVRCLGLEPGRARPTAQLVVVLAVTQLIAGFLNVALLAPVWMQVLHLLLADLLWIGCVVLAARSLAAAPAVTPGASPVSA